MSPGTLRVVSAFAGASCVCCACARRRTSALALINIRKLVGIGQGVVFGKGRSSSGLGSETIGAGFLRRSRTCDKRRSIIYGDSLIGGGSEDFEGSSAGGVCGAESGDGNGEGRAGIGGAREAFDEILENNDVSYAIVVSNIWRKRMKASKRRRCIFDGLYACPTKSRTTARPSDTPSIACVQTHPKLKNTSTKYQNRNERLGSISLGFEHWNWENRRLIKPSNDGERKNESVCSWKRSVSSECMICCRCAW